MQSQYRIRWMSLIPFIAVLCAGNAFSIADPPLPEGVCEQVMSKYTGMDSDINKCKLEATEQTTGSGYVDLNDDGVKELVFIYGGYSCGSMYWVFRLNENAVWKYSGSFCGCEWDEEQTPPPYTILNKKMSGFKVIKTCGVIGLFNGNEYVGRRQ